MANLLFKLKPLRMEPEQRREDIGSIEIIVIIVKAIVVVIVRIRVITAILWQY